MAQAEQERTQIEEESTFSRRDLFSVPLKRPQEDIEAVPEMPDLGKRISRRGFIKLSAGTVAATGLAVVGHRAWQIYQFLDIGPVKEFKHPAINEALELTNSGFEKTTIVTIGDGLVSGHWKDGKSEYSAANEVVKRMRGKNKKWEVISLANKDSNINQASLQLDTLPLYIAGRKNVELFISAGSDDLLTSLSGMREELEDVQKNKLKLLTDPVDQKIYHKIKETQKRFTSEILDKIVSLKKNNVPINRAVFVDFPNISQSDIEYKPDDGSPVITISLNTGSSLERNLARKVLYDANNSFANAIEDFHKRSGIDVLLLNAFALPVEQLYGIQPSPHGQVALADQYMQHTFYTIDGRRYSLDQIVKHKIRTK